MQRSHPLRTGVLLNAVSFSLLSAPVLCDTNLSLYLRALAISDNGALIFNYAVSVAKSHSTSVNDLFMVNILACRPSSRDGPPAAKNSSGINGVNLAGSSLMETTVTSICSSNDSFQLDPRSSSIDGSLSVSTSRLQ